MKIMVESCEYCRKKEPFYFSMPKIGLFIANQVLKQCQNEIFWNLNFFVREGILEENRKYWNIAMTQITLPFEKRYGYIISAIEDFGDGIDTEIPLAIGKEPVECLKRLITEDMII